MARVPSRQFVRLLREVKQADYNTMRSGHWATFQPNELFCRSKILSEDKTLKARVTKPAKGSRRDSGDSPRGAGSRRSLLLPTRPQFALIAVLVFISGGAALVFQVAWMRELRLVFGATTAAVSAVLAIFMIGLGLGSVVLGQRSDKSPNPLRLYGVLEAGIAASAFATPWLISLISWIYINLGGQETLGVGGATAIRLLLAAAVMIVPTFLMGGTLPAAVRAVTPPDDTHRRALGLIYGANTFGRRNGGRCRHVLRARAPGHSNDVMGWLRCWHVRRRGGDRFIARLIIQLWSAAGKPNCGGRHVGKLSSRSQRRATRESHDGHLFHGGRSRVHVFRAGNCLVSDAGAHFGRHGLYVRPHSMHRAVWHRNRRHRVQRPVQPTEADLVRAGYYLRLRSAIYHRSLCNRRSSGAGCCSATALSRKFPRAGCGLELCGRNRRSANCAGQWFAIPVAHRASGDGPA